MTATGSPGSGGRAVSPGWWAMGWVLWGYCTDSRQVHAFEVEELPLGTYQRRSVCGYLVLPVWVPPEGARRCPQCVSGVRSPGTGRRHRRVELRWWTRAMARLRLLLGRR